MCEFGLEHLTDKYFWELDALRLIHQCSQGKKEVRSSPGSVDCGPHGYQCFYFWLVCGDDGTACHSAWQKIDVKKALQECLCSRSHATSLQMLGASLMQAPMLLRALAALDNVTLVWKHD